MIARLFASLRGLLVRRRIDGEILEELQDHLEREIEAHRRRGVPPEEARRLALRDLGGLTQTIESTRAVRATWLDTFWRDLSYGARLLRRSSRFTVTALTVLVLGIGSTTAIFSIAYAVLVRPLPYADPDPLVFLAELRGLAPARHVVRRDRELTGRRRVRHGRRISAAGRLEKRDRQLLRCARHQGPSRPALRPVRRPA